MAEQTDNLEKIKQLIANAQNIAVIPSEIAGADSFTAAVGLYYTLRSREKDVSLIYVAEVPSDASEIVDPEDITEDVYSRQLKISIDYSDTPASKLAYSNENNVLHLVLAPVSKEFDQSKIRTQIQGSDFDLIFLLGVQNLADLGVIYRELRENFGKAEVINMDNTALNTKHGSVNVIDKSASNLSSVVFKFLSKIGYVPNGKAARALLKGMSYREPQG